MLKIKGGGYLYTTQLVTLGFLAKEYTSYSLGQPSCTDL